MRVLLATGVNIRHSYFLTQASARFDEAIVGVVRQGAVPSPTTPKTSVQSPPLRTAERLTSLLYVLQSKRMSLRERAAFWRRPRILARSLLGKPLLATSDINGPDALRWLDEHPADLLVVFGGRILKPEVIRKFQRGVLNIHMGLSPHYRGSNCLEWPLYHGKPELVGATVHYIDEGIDSGAIIVQTRTDLGSRPSLARVVADTYKDGLSSLLDTTEKVLNGDPLTAEPQPAGVGFCYYGRHFAPEIRLGAANRLRRPRSPFRARVAARIRRDVFGVLGRVGGYAGLMPRLPYPAILLYHEIGNGRSAFLRRADLHISLERFRSHVELLARFYKVVSVRDVYEACRDGRKLEGTIAFSFDDGNRGILDAFGVLEEYGFPATAYINPDFAAGRNVFWRSKLSYLLETGRGPDLCAALASELGENVAEADVFGWTKSHVVDENVERITDDVFDRFGGDDGADGLYATWDELKSVNRELFTFGNHTLRHSCMAALPRVEQEKHIIGAKDEINSELGDDRVGLSIPFGERHHYDAATLEISNSAYDFYLSAYGGINVVGLGKELKRIGIPNAGACQLPRLLGDAVVG